MGWPRPRDNPAQTEFTETFVPDHHTTCFLEPPSWSIIEVPYPLLTHKALWDFSMSYDHGKGMSVWKLYASLIPTLSDSMPPLQVLKETHPQQAA